MTRTVLEGLAFGDELMPLDQNNALAIQMPVLGSGGMHPFQTVADYDHFLARTAAFDRWVNTAISNMQRGMATGFTQPKVVIERAIPQLESQIVARPEDSAFWGPIARMPAGISAADRERLTGAYRKAISETLVPAYKRLRDFFSKEYLPACLDEVGVWQLARGGEMYAMFVRQYTTTKLTPDEVHQLGLSEVKRISGEIERIAREQGFKGTAGEYIAMLRKNPADPARNEAELLARYQAFKTTAEPRLPRPSVASQGRLRGAPHRAVSRSLGIQPVHAGDPRWLAAGRLLRERGRAQEPTDLCLGLAVPPRGAPRPSLPDRPDQRERCASAAAAHPSVQRLHRGLGALRVERLGEPWAVQDDVQSRGRPGRRVPPRLPPGRRHRLHHEGWSRKRR